MLCLLNLNPRSLVQIQKPNPGSNKGNGAKRYKIKDCKNGSEPAKSKQRKRQPQQNHERKPSSERDLEKYSAEKTEKPQFPFNFAIRCKFGPQNNYKYLERKREMSKPVALLLVLLASSILCQVPVSTTCGTKCADCRTDLGQTMCYGCYMSAMDQNRQCTLPQLPNCLISDNNGQCTTCVTGYAIDTSSGTANCLSKGTVANCMLEYVDTPTNKCVVCNGSNPTDDLTACGNMDSFDATDCLWGTVLQQCIRCKADNMMAAAAGECVGRYLYGCLQENGIGRCNGCDMENGFYMKFGTMCWKD